MNANEQAAYAEIICNGFTNTEIDCLEDMSQWCWEQMSKGNEIELPDELLLEVIAEYEGDANA